MATIQASLTGLWIAYEFASDLEILAASTRASARDTTVRLRINERDNAPRTVFLLPLFPGSSHHHARRLGSDPVCVVAFVAGRSLSNHDNGIEENLGQESDPGSDQVKR